MEENINLIDNFYLPKVEKDFVDNSSTVKVLNDNQDKVREFKKGKTKLLGFFVGQTMKESKGKANPKILNKILINKLK